MKKLTFILIAISLLFFSQTANAQINLEHTFDGSVQYSADLPRCNYYIQLSGFQVKLYSDENYSLYKSVTVTPPTNYTILGVYNPCQNVFTTDNKVTFFVICYNNSASGTNQFCTMRLYNEDGTIVRDFGYSSSFLFPYIHRTSNNKYRLYVNRTTSTSNKTEIYSLPGTPPLAPTITTIILPSGTVGTAYNQTLTANGDAPITWDIANGNLPNGLSLSSSGEISGIPTTAETANFSIKASNNTGSNTKELSIFIDEETGISGLQLAEIKIFPNPTSDKLVVDCEDNLQNRIIFYDMTGKKVLNQNIAGKTEIDISNLEKGVYIVSIMSESEVVGNFKIVKQ